MQRDAILALKGRELDFAIETALFGAQWRTSLSLNSASLLPAELMRNGPHFSDMVPGRMEGTETYCPGVPAYSTWQEYGKVFAEMERREYKGEITKTFARFVRGTIDEKSHEQPIPLAVARAALLALQEEE